MGRRIAPPLRSGFDTVEEYLEALESYEDELSLREMAAEERYYESRM